jgi:hypothetical protein
MRSGFLGVAVCLLAVCLADPRPASAAGSEAPAAEPSPLTWSSGAQRVLLIELFTSEGCSSCPPAERWMNSLRERSQLWSGFIPLVWHVDYWDGLGWRDPFAAPHHAERQRAYVRSGLLSQVYTPGVLRGGREWRRWPGRIDEAQPVDVGTLDLLIDSRATVTFTPARPGRFVAHVARLGFGLVSSVAAGENAGRELRHEFVVLASHSAAMQPAGEGEWSVTLDLPDRDPGSTAGAWVAWVEEEGSPLPLQATGGPDP